MPNEKKGGGMKSNLVLNRRNVKLLDFVLKSGKRAAIVVPRIRKMLAKSKGEHSGSRIFWNYGEERAREMERWREHASGEREKEK